MNENRIIDGGCLYITCFDVITVKDGVTFTSCLIHGMQVTFWTEGHSEADVLNAIYDSLFAEVLKFSAIKGG